MSHSRRPPSTIIKRKDTMAMLLDAKASETAQRRVAGALRKRGMTEGDRIALLVPGSTDYVSVVLGALRAGIVPVPLDPRLTAYERDAILSDIVPGLVVNHPEDLVALTQGPEAELAAWPRCRPMHFTSGTTGRPKGVWSGMLSADDAEALILEERDLWSFSADDINLVVSPIYHSAPLRFAMGTLLAGGSIAVVPEFSPEGFAAAVAEVRPTTMFCVPAHLQRLFSWLDETGSTIDVSSFRLVAHAGAPCPQLIRRRTHQLFGQDAVWEFYGSTEGQFTACSAADSLRYPGSLGRSRPGRTMWTDDEGQLWCTVPPWARFTYWRDPDKTATTWTETPDGPAFTVGDLGRVVDGLVYLDARRVDLMITGGVNVYPAEVEAALEDTPGLVEIAVYGKPDERWGTRVCAAYVGDVSPAALKARADERLSPPKRPKEYLAVAELPRTHTGKVRRTHLPRP